MALPEIKFCPGNLAIDNNTYSSSCLKRMFEGKKLSHVLQYESLESNESDANLFWDNQKRISLSGVQEKFSMLLDKNNLRLTKEGEQGTYILKPIPTRAKKCDQMPANEHLTMQIAQQIFGIETAENCLIFFKNGSPAYLTKRFDIDKTGAKLGQEDFASLSGKTPQTNGEHYKYSGNYFELFELMKVYLPAYKVEAPKLFKVLIFNYLFSNGDAHLKNFSLLETAMGDYRLSPFYDLLNSRIHVEDSDFALEDGLLSRNLAKGKLTTQFYTLAEEAGIRKSIAKAIFEKLTSNPEKISKLISASYLDDKTKRNYIQAYQTRLNKLLR